MPDDVTLEGITREHLDGHVAVVVDVLDLQAAPARGE
jgi:hypothetical protein